MKRISVLIVLIAFILGASAQFSSKDFKLLCNELSLQEATKISQNVRMMWDFEAQQNYSSAAGLGIAAYESIKQSRGKAARSKGFAMLMDHIALDLSYIGHTPEALYLGRESVKLWKEITGEHSAEYANAISNLATYYSQQNDRIRAEQLVDSGLVLCANDKQLRNSYAELLHTKMVIEISSGQIDRALDTYKSLSELPVPMQDSWSESFIYALSSKGDYTAAVQNQRDLLSKVDKSKDANGWKCARYRYRLSYYLKMTGCDDEAAENLQNAIDYYRTNASTLNVEYARCLSLYSSIDELKGRYEAAINKEKHSVEILKRLLPVNAPQLLNAQRHLVDMQFRHGDRAEALRSVYACTRQDMQNMKYSMSMTREIRSNIWESSNYWYTISLPYYASQCQRDSLLVLAYDATLLAKGLLLNVETNIADEVSKGDSLLQQLYADWIASKNTLEDAQTFEAFQQAKSLSEQKEQLFMRYYRQISPTYERLNVTWEKVESALSVEEMAVELVTYPHNGQYVYAALILKNGMKHPEIVAIGTEADLLSAYEDSRIASLFSERLMPYAKGVSKIYFSPTRKLYDIPLESMFLKELPQCQYSLYRISSTRNLAKVSNAEKTNRKVTIFGGIDYEACLNANSIGTKGNEHAASEKRTILSLRGAANGFPYLQGTLDEARLIDTILNGHAEVKMVLGADGTETAFRGLSGEEISVLHIGTHGFYADSNQEEDFGWLPVFNDENKNLRTKEDEALSRSGLLLAGATNTINGEEVAVDMDGILTAQEISNIDLRGLDLVTLSACETALGDITGEGVFGLQRGFKKAGANSILMSLWKVDDAATCKLMTEFYSNWIGKKMTKHDALEAAKKTVRETKGWEDPKYWAAFILLDGLD